MQFFEKHSLANIRLINQLWQSDFLDSPSRNAALALLGRAHNLKNWLKHIFLILAIVFLCASILLFFAYNWSDIPPIIKMGAILTLIALLAVGNLISEIKRKPFIANLILTSNCFLIGVFMAVFGQIYQTGADAYTLFLTWAIMVLPFALNINFLPLWTLWLIVANIALLTWLELGFMSNILVYKINDQLLISLFNLLVYIGYELLLLNKNNQNLNKAWMRILLAMLIFIPVSFYIIVEIIDSWSQFFDYISLFNIVIFVGFYLFIKFVKKSIYEYNVGYICGLIMLIFVAIRISFELVDMVSFVILLDIFAVGILLKYAYQYYHYAIHKMKVD